MYVSAAITAKSRRIEKLLNEVKLDKVKWGDGGKMNGMLVILTCSGAALLTKATLVSYFYHYLVDIQGLRDQLFVITPYITICGWVL